MENIISVLYGILVCFVDDMNDSGTTPHLKLVFEIILALLTVYIFYFTKNLGFVTSFLFFFGAIVYILFAPDVLSSNIFRIMVALSFPPMVYHLVHNIPHIEDNLYFISIVIGTFVIGSILTIIEDKLVPEEFSYRKILERVFQLLLSILSIVYIDTLQLSTNQTEAISWVLYGWGGYMLANVATMLYLMFWLEK